MSRQVGPVQEKFTAFLDRGSRFEGTLSFQGTVRIDGVFRGEIVSGNVLILGDQAEVRGTITVDEVVISGSFTGTVVATRRIALLAPAVVTGDLHCPKLSVEEGASFNGKIEMGGHPAVSKSQTLSDAELMAEAITKRAEGPAH